MIRAIDCQYESDPLGHPLLGVAGIALTCDTRHDQSHIGFHCMSFRSGRVRRRGRSAKAASERDLIAERKSLTHREWHNSLWQPPSVPRQPAELRTFTASRRALEPLSAKRRMRSGQDRQVADPRSASRRQRSSSCRTENPAPGGRALGMIRRRGLLPRFIKAMLTPPKCKANEKRADKPGAASDLERLLDLILDAQYPNDLRAPARPGPDPCRRRAGFASIVPRFEWGSLH